MERSKVGAGLATVRRTSAVPARYSTGLRAYGIRTRTNHFGCASFAGLDNRTGCSDGYSNRRVSTREYGYGDRLVNFETITGVAFSVVPVQGAAFREFTDRSQAEVIAMGARTPGKGVVVAAGGGGSHWWRGRCARHRESFIPKV
jgi:hypothetical protein